MSEVLETQRCRGCKRDLPLECFTPGARGICRECNNRKTKEWHAKNPERARRMRAEAHARRVATPEGRQQVRGWKYKARYGITIEQYEQMLGNQDGHCALCPTEPAPGEYLSVDHDHETEEVRGLLCTDCNHGLGRFHDDLERLMAAAAYLLAGRAEPSRT